MSSEIIVGANNVFHLTLVNASSGLVKYLGRPTGGPAACAALCASFKGDGGAFAVPGERCHSWTHHDTTYDEDPRLRGACHGHVTDNWAPRWNQRGVTSGRVAPPPPPRCTSAASCEMNGACDAQSGACLCAPGWMGPTCGKLDLLPLSAASAGGYRRANTSSWGGSIAMAGNATGKMYHLFAAEMEHGCGLLSCKCCCRRGCTCYCDAACARLSLTCLSGLPISSPMIPP